MALALEWARSARGFSSPNPPVGAVILRNGVVVGAGATQPVGGPHAEVVALQTAGEAARGATIYVTLEPHSFHGHTPPCTDAIIAAGITRAVVATMDPNPHVAGDGLEQLRTAGIEVDVGLCATEANHLVAPFAHWLITKQPLGIAKFAMSLDGKVATRAGASQWISGLAARHLAHELRQASDAIIVGSGTALADDPLLTTRLPELPADRMRHPLRVVVDGRGRLSPQAKMLAPDVPGHTLVATNAMSAVTWREAIAATGAEVAVLPDNSGSSVDLVALWNLLGERGCLTAIIEGGSALLGAVLTAGLVQRVSAFIAPMIIGGVRAPSPFGGDGFRTLADASRFRWTALRRIGDDVLLEGEIEQEKA